MNIYDDPHTVQPDELVKSSSRDFVEGVLGHFYTGPDGFVYQVIGYRENDGPWIEEVLGRAPTRTISMRAIDRTFHHHDKCAVSECRAHSYLRMFGSVARGKSAPDWVIEWDGVQQVTDGKTLWINAPDGMCIGRLSPKGIDVHGSARQQADGDHCLHCEEGPNPFGDSVAFAQYVRFVEKMKEHHNVQVSKGVPLRITPTPRMIGGR